MFFKSFIPYTITKRVQSIWAVLGVWFNGVWVGLNCRQALLAADLCHPTVPFQVVLFCRCSCIFFR